MNYLETVANFASILTAIFAFAAWVYYLASRACKQSKLEDYLKKEKAKSNGNYQHTMVHLMANLRMTEDDILRAAFDSPRVRCPVRANKDTKLATEILFEYDPKD